MDVKNVSVPKLLFKMSPPVMLALLIQSIYNIADSFFVARYSTEGLTALSIVYPVQLLITALATGTGAGVNILISRLDGKGETEAQHDIIKSGLFLNIFHFLIFAFVGNMLVNVYFSLSTGNAVVKAQGIIYGRIIFSGSLGLFTESICTKILQARRNMVIPMIAQVTGSIVNIILDVILIFGIGRIPAFGIMGAAIATVIGQWVAMMITLFAIMKKYSLRGQFKLDASKQIYINGIGSIVTQSLYTIYIVGLNMILKIFTEDAVTVLGIYYKIQSFFFIPLLGFQQVLLPLFSYHYGAGDSHRNREILKWSMMFSVSIMTVATGVFFLFPKKLVQIFSTESAIMEIGKYAFPVISISFIFAGLTIVITSYLQGIAHIKISLFIIVLRQIVLLVPLAWLFHFISLNAVWWTFPVTEIIASMAGILIILILHK
ncbi:MAG TPA: MATE family efflux transporter [Lachnospiraceae bacterium]|nr:MATE family efflux transporter [uncultured Lachnoclostridium sp.]HAU87144.1 MATE family efflux transporter [Lachnospiraceae bacterium]